jgi:single-strand DNA-binding protein
MNKVCLVGNICRDVELKVTGGENASAMLRNTIAVQRKFKNKETGQYESDFINFMCFGTTAEFISKYFTKGQKIGITGRIQTGSYTNKDGVKVYTTDVVVEDAEFVTPKGENGGSAPAGNANDFINQGIDEDELNSNLPF